MTAREVLAAAKKRADAATEGPWESEYSGEQGTCVLPPDAQSTREAVAVTRLYYAVYDANFIAAARTDVPAFVAALTAVLDLVDQRRRLIALHPEDLDGVGGVAVEAFCDDIAATIEHHLREED